MSSKGAQARNLRNYNRIGSLRRGKTRRIMKIKSLCASRMQLIVYLSKVIHIQLLSLQEYKSFLSVVIKLVQLTESNASQKQK